MPEQPLAKTYHLGQCSGMTPLRMVRVTLLHVDKSALRERLDQENVAADAYDLDGDGADEPYVLERSGGGFAVFYSERGLRTGERRFGTEAEACRHLLDLLLRDRTTRR
jgi:hypothetical protein